MASLAWEQNLGSALETECKACGLTTMCKYDIKNNAWLCQDHYRHANAQDMIFSRQMGPKFQGTETGRLSYNNPPISNTPKYGPVDDPVNHPAHYGGDTTYEAIKVIEAWRLNFNLGNVLKYICRGKNTEDLKKARWYLDREIAGREAIYSEFPGLDNVVAAISEGTKVQPNDSYKLVVERYRPPPAAKCGSCGHDSDYHVHVSKYDDTTGKSDPDSVSCAVCGCQQKQPATLEAYGPPFNTTISVCKQCSHAMSMHNRGVNNDFEWSSCQLCDCYITKPLSDPSNPAKTGQDTESHHHLYGLEPATNDLAERLQKLSQSLDQLSEQR